MKETGERGDLCPLEREKRGRLEKHVSALKTVEGNPVSGQLVGGYTREHSMLNRNDIDELSCRADTHRTTVGAASVLNSFDPRRTLANWEGSI